MYNGIDWLPELIDESCYNSKGIIDYKKLIEDTYNIFCMDFCNPSSPIIFENKRVVIDEKILDCTCLKVKNCYNLKYFDCNDCKFKSCFDIFNHICTDDYELLHKKNKTIKVPKLKKRKRNRIIPRVPGKFNIERLKRVVWIKSIIEHSAENPFIAIKRNTYFDDKLNIEVIADINLELKQEKYKIVIKPIYEKATGIVKYYVMKTAFYMGK